MSKNMRVSLNCGTKKRIAAYTYGQIRPHSVSLNWEVQYPNWEKKSKQAETKIDRARERGRRREKERERKCEKNLKISRKNFLSRSG